MVIHILFSNSGCIVQKRKSETPEIKPAKNKRVKTHAEQDGINEDVALEAEADILASGHHPPDIAPVSRKVPRIDADILAYYRHPTRWEEIRKEVEVSLSSAYPCPRLLTTGDKTGVQRLEKLYVRPLSELSPTKRGAALDKQLPLMKNYRIFLEEAREEEISLQYRLLETMRLREAIFLRIEAAEELLLEIREEFTH